MDRKQRFAAVDIYPVICDLAVLRGVIAGGAKIVQLREKEYSKQQLTELAREFRNITSQHNVLLIINDHLDIALAVGADGVHLGQDDLPLREARQLAPDLLIGISTHNLAEALSAEKDGADYINIGPVFQTQTKDMRPIGVGAIKEISSQIKIPFTVMGGINLDNIMQVLAAGARKVAVVTAITQAEDVEAATRQLRQLIRG